jgi:hypothetical protein
MEKDTYEFCSKRSWADFIKHNVNKLELSLSTHVGDV